MMIQNVQDDKRVVYNSLRIVLSFNIESIPELYNTVWISEFKFKFFSTFAYEYQGELIRYVSWLRKIKVAWTVDGE